jgi:hypothetical protein
LTLVSEEEMPERNPPNADAVGDDVQRTGRSVSPFLNRDSQRADRSFSGLKCPQATERPIGSLAPELLGGARSSFDSELVDDRLHRNSISTASMVT